MRAQAYDDRWGRATVVYGIAALMSPIFVVAVVLFSDADSTVPALGAVSSVLVMIWLARSAHDLAAPRRRPAGRAAPELLGAGESE
ncbi:hypothetical protein ACGFJC_25880 [Nonomuraea fuscirosea]|uniref:hypothetical protein n=1 Tax=Nonomuraea fuscirosea TaxID=1291556 RepID=UPI0037202236